jgi:UDP-galactopyranose mutase
VFIRVKILRSLTKTYMKSALIIGGGFAGCAAAHQLALQGGWDVTLVESAPFLGAGVRTKWYGGHPYTFGPRHFLTREERLFDFLNRYVPLRRLKHVFLTYVERDAQFYNFPIHVDDIERMPDRDRIRRELAEVKTGESANNVEEYWLGSVGPTLYEKFAKHYNHKMWQIEDNRLLDDAVPSWTSKGALLYEGPREGFHDAISAYPYAPNGYDDYFGIATAEATVLLSTTIEKYDIPRRRVQLSGQWREFDAIINTIGADALFERCFGELKFVGLEFHPIVLPVEQCFPGDVFFLYYSGQEKFKRLVEYKKFTQHKAPTTLIGIEFPSMNGKYYALPMKSERSKALRYIDLMPANVFSIGRAGSYRYIDIDDCIAQAMEVAEKLK